MLQVPPGDHILRLIGIDPGTDTLGVAALEVDLVHLQATVVDAQTFVAKYAMKYGVHYQSIGDKLGARYGRLRSHADAIMAYFCDFRPHDVACESPFMGRHAEAFQALTECLDMLRWSAYRYDPSVGFTLVTPPQAKKAVGVSHQGTTKDDIKVAIAGMLQQPAQYGLHYRANCPLEHLDEHSVDALAVAIHQYQQWVEALTH